MKNKPKFKVGDRVIIIGTIYTGPNGRIGTIIRVIPRGLDAHVLYETTLDKYPLWWEHELIEANEVTEALYAK